MYSLKTVFEKVLWNSRYVVLIAVISSVLAGVVLFCVIGLESLRTLASLSGYANLTMALEERDAILRQGILREIALIDGYLLGAFMFIILIVEIFKDAFDIKAHSPLDLLYVAAAIALIGLALYLTRGSELEKKDRADFARQETKKPMSE